MDLEDASLKKNIIELIEEISQKIGKSCASYAILEKQTVAQLMSILEKIKNEYVRQLIDEQRSINDKYDMLKKEYEHKKSKSIVSSR